MLNAWLAPVREQLPADFSPEDASHLQKAIMDEALCRFGSFLAGIQAYQQNPFIREEELHPVLWQSGTTRLIDYAPTSKGPILFVIPSLVNRFEILDIDPAHSFLRFLAAQGLRPLVVDWQAPGEEEINFSLADYLTKRLEPALAFAQSVGGPCHVLGYCMGGVLALTLALKQPLQIQTLTLMATPWDFGVAGVAGVPAADTYLGSLFLRYAETWTPTLEKLGYLPPDFLQAVFTGFQPLQVLQKFTRFAGLSSEAEETRRFVLTEDWLNDGVPLAWPVARECLQDWYAGNLTARLAWRIDDVLIDPREIKMPTYVLIAGKDRIVPPPSSEPLAKLIRGAHLHVPSMGHIGLMTGDVAPQDVWKPLVSWLMAHTHKDE